LLALPVSTNFALTVPKGWILLTAIGLDAIVLVAFATLKLKNDPTIVLIAAGIMIAVFGFEYFYLRKTSNNGVGHKHSAHNNKDHDR
jgi:hypothetical protein